MAIVEIFSKWMDSFMSNHPDAISFRKSIKIYTLMRKLNSDPKIENIFTVLRLLPVEFWNDEHYGKGLWNKLLSSGTLPELHLRNIFTGERYNFCGPGTKLDERLARGDQPINELDAACMKHDIHYKDHKEVEERHPADKDLQLSAKRIQHDPNTPWYYKADAALVRGAMYAKRHLGMGVPSRDQWHL